MGINIRERLKWQKPLLLDGATGTEIKSRGVETPLPLWSAKALISNPDVVKNIHKDYIKAGAEIIRTNTFRTNKRTLEKCGIKNQDNKLTQKAVDLVRTAIKESDTDRQVYIAGSQTTLEDCYSPELVPEEETCYEEHKRWANNLRNAGVDFILLETINSIKEARAALNAIKEARIDVCISFVCGKDHNLLSKEPLENAVKEAEKFRPLAIMINCMQPEDISITLPKLKNYTNLPTGAYGQGLGVIDGKEGWKFAPDSDSLPSYLKHVQKWINYTPMIIGGCCGTNPGFIKAIHELTKE